MSRTAYQERLQSVAWKLFTRQCRVNAGERCQMCGAQAAELHSHHMRYCRKGLVNEWQDVIVLCSCCHGHYHESHPSPPHGLRPRLALCNELAAALMKKGRDVSFFLKHGTDLCDHWINTPIVMRGLLIQPDREATPKPPRPKYDKLPRSHPQVMKIREQKQQGQKCKDAWKPDPKRFTLAQARRFVKSNDPLFETEAFQKAFGIPVPPPRRWQKHLRKSLRVHFNLSKSGFQI